MPKPTLILFETHDEEDFFKILNKALPHLKNQGYRYFGEELNSQTQKSTRDMWKEIQKEISRIKTLLQSKTADPEDRKRNEILLEQLKLSEKTYNLLNANEIETFFMDSKLRSNDSNFCEDIDLIIKISPIRDKSIASKLIKKSKEIEPNAGIFARCGIAHAPGIIKNLILMEGVENVKEKYRFLCLSSKTTLFYKLMQGEKWDLPFNLPIASQQITIDEIDNLLAKSFLELNLAEPKIETWRQTCSQEVKILKPIVRIYKRRALLGKEIQEYFENNSPKLTVKVIFYELFLFLAAILTKMNRENIKPSEQSIDSLLCESTPPFKTDNTLNKIMKILIKNVYEKYKDQKLLEPNAKNLIEVEKQSYLEQIYTGATNMLETAKGIIGGTLFKKASENQHQGEQTEEERPSCTLS